jgi:hypothetical protein
MFGYKQVAVVIVSFLLLIYAFGIYRQLPKIRADYIDRDCFSYYQAAQKLLEGINPYVADAKWGAPGDTPTWHLFFEPFAATLSPVSTYWVWLAINLGALSTSLWLLMREAGVRNRWLLAAIILMYPPAAYNLWGGMQQIFLLLVFVLMLLALNRRRDFLAGLALGAAILLRAYPLGMVGYLVAIRRWRAVAWTLVFSTMGAGLTILLVGWPVVLKWVEFTSLWHPSSSPFRVPYSVSGFPNNLNLSAFIRWLFDPTGSLGVPPLITVLALIAELGLVAIAFVAVFRRGGGADLDWRGYGLWIVTVSWISPLSWIVYMCCFIPLFVGLVAAWERGDGSVSPPALWAMAASFGLLTLVPPIGHPLYPMLTHSVTATLNSIKPLGSASAVKARTATAALSAHHLHWITGARFAALALAWLSAWWFVRTPQIPIELGQSEAA